MDRLHMWIMWLVVSYILVGLCLVMLGQPVRPVGHLVKATTFWYLVSQVLLVVSLGVLYLYGPITH